MYLTQSNIIRGLSKREYLMLRMMCFLSKNLYNVTLYNIRQYYFTKKKHLRYESNYHVTKDNENYKKGSLFNLILQSNAISIKGGCLAVPMSNAFMSIYGREKIKIKVPEHVPKEKIKEVRIIPILNGKKFKIQNASRIAKSPSARSAYV